MRYVSTYGIQFYVSVGDGTVSHVFPDEQHTTVESAHIPKLLGHPIVFNMGCYNGNIDRAFVDAYNQTSVPTLVHSFMVNGAAVYIGDTVETAVEWPKICLFTALPQEKGSIPEMISIYEHFGGNKTIGEAFREMKNSWGAERLADIAVGCEHAAALRRPDYKEISAQSAVVCKLWLRQERPEMAMGYLEPV